MAHRETAPQAPLDNPVDECLRPRALAHWDYTRTTHMSVAGAASGIAADVASRAGDIADTVRRAGRSGAMLWVPGTGEKVAPKAVTAAATHILNMPTITVPYPASWDILNSIKDGDAILRGVLDNLAANPAEGPVVMMGKSQGAWVMARALNQIPAEAQPVRSALLGLPGFARFEMPGNPVGVSDAARHAVINHLDDPYQSFASATSLDDLVRDMRKPTLLKGVFTDSSTREGVGRLIKRAVLNHVPGIDYVDPHEYISAIPRAAEFLSTGKVSDLDARHAVTLLA